MPSKPALSANQLQALIRERIDAYPDLAGKPSDVDQGVVWIDPGDSGGPNWSVPVRSNRDRYSTTVARIIRDVQREYDLDTD